MASENENFTMKQGETAEITFTIVDGDGAAQGLTGAVLTWKCARSRYESVLLTKTDGSGLEIVSEELGTVKVTLDPADTAALLGDYYHELKLVDDSDRADYVTTGSITVEKVL